MTTNTIHSRMQLIPRNLFFRIAYVILGFLCVHNTVNAQVANTKYIYLKGELIKTERNVEKWIQDNSNTLDSTLVLVQFSTLPNEDVKKNLMDNGIIILDYIPHNSYAAIITSKANLNILKTSGAEYITGFRKEWKTNNQLWNVLDNGRKSIDILLSVQTTITKEQAYNRLLSLGGKILNTDLESFNLYKLSIASSKIDDLISWYGTKYITVSHQDKPLNFESKTALGINVAASPLAFGGYSLHGEGMVVGVGDNVSGNFHIDLKDRIINFNPAAYTDHGVHINGIVGGAGIIDPVGEGMAPRAILIDHFYSSVLDQTPQLFEGYNMTVTNNSYASVVGNCGYAGNYDLLSVFVDELALAYNKVLHVFAAGNDGNLKCTPYPDGFGTVTGGYQPAKNNIVVTSTNKWFVNAYDGSRGPVQDGRLKPEITAIGVEVNSTTKKEEYLVAAGTSMASPEVAGGAAILAQRYKELNSGVDPLSDILKTVLLNGTTDIGLKGPDFRFGFGFMNIARSLQILDSSWYYVDTITNGALQTVNITVPPNTAKLKVMLYYHDPAASPSAGIQLVNDLDLEVADPSNIIHQPLIADPTLALITTAAKQGVDRLNNCEQVTIDNPQKGNYIINVKGFFITNSSQRYVVAYDFEPVGMKMMYPQAGAQVKAGDSLRIYWNASTNPNTITLEYSTDNGNAWNIVDNNIAADTSYYVWYVPDNINSGECLMRISRNGSSQNDITGQFAINNQPKVKLSTEQCPGYMQMEWGSIPNATGYEILQKIGAQLQVIDTTADTTYTINGLNPNEYCYASIRPIINGLQGYRSLAIKRLPNDGNCIGNISDGDLAIDRLVSPTTGRKETSLELSTSNAIVVSIRNLDDVDASNYRVSYKINNGVWQSNSFTNTIVASKTLLVNLGNADLSATGNYDIRVAVENLAMADAVTSNDTLSIRIKHLNNNPLNLIGNYFEGFENIDRVTSTNDSMGISPNENWDYFNSTDTGRFRSFVHSGITISGNRSVSLDAYKNMTGNLNELIGTFNLKNYDANSTELRLEFDYIVHGSPAIKDSNNVWIRGQDTNPWQRVYNYDLSNNRVGIVQNSGSISISDGLLNNGQDFTSSSQIKFNQYDSTVIGDVNRGAGITIDNVRLYTVQNDVQLVSIVTPEAISCGRQNETPLTINVRNGVNQAQTNIDVFYQLNGGTVIKETIPNLAGKTSLNYTFNTTLDLSAPGSYNIDVWIVANGDSYTKNDSILNYKTRTQPKINTFPYVQDFELNDGYWYTEGVKSSWEYGTPTANKISAAASATKAWVTNLDGNYNDDEFSYLISPCFDLSKIQNPRLNFKAAIDIENCGFVLCDGAFMQYSTDGINWDRLDITNATKEYANWYNDTGYRIWSVQDFTDWHQVAISLPTQNNNTSTPFGFENFQLRFVMFSDLGANFEGFGIDDVVIEERKYYAPTNEVITISPNPTSNGNINIEWAAPAGQQMQIVMTDILGKQVYQSSTTAVEGYNKTTIVTPRFASGIYLMRVIIGDKEHIQKIVYQ